MSAPLEGIKVLEVASWLAAPSCAALMADMGAEVIKVEPVAGEAYRRMYAALYGEDFVAPCYQFDNRGKRGICVNLEDPEGVAIVHTLAARAQVFITNLTRPRLERYRLTDEDVHALAPQAILRGDVRLWHRWAGQRAPGIRPERLLGAVGRDECVRRPRRRSPAVPGRFTATAPRLSTCSPAFSRRCGYRRRRARANSWK